jgi:hypothetical protein
MTNNGDYTPSNPPRLVDFSVALAYLTWLDPRPDAVFTFQTYDDDSKEERAALTSVRHTRNAAELAALLPELKRLNDNGAGIFVTVNETNGFGRKTENIIRVRALYIDLDGPSVQTVMDWELPPHWINGSSPGRFHCYWKVEGMPLEDFKAAQKALIDRFNADIGVNDLPHVMRVPGFYHRKCRLRDDGSRNEPFLTRIHHFNKDLPPYRANQFEKKPQPMRVPRSSDDNELNPLLAQAVAKYIPNNNLDWNDWNLVGMAIWRESGGSDAGFKVFDEFSQRCPGKYNARRTLRRWQHYSSSPPYQIGIKKLIWFANQADPEWGQKLDRELMESMDQAAQEAHGMSLYELNWLATPEEQRAGAPAIKRPAPTVDEPWVRTVAAPQGEPQTITAEQMTTATVEPEGETQKQSKTTSAPPPPPPPPPQTKLIVSSKQFIANFVPPDYLIEGLLQRRFIYSFTGLTGAGKTAIALLLTAHVANGLPLPGRTVEKGKVLYFAGENPDDVRMRWIKLCEEMRLDPNTEAVFWREGTMLLANPNQWKQTIADCRAAGPFAMFIVDTAAAFFPGAGGEDENNNVQAGSYARLLRSLTQEILGGPTGFISTHPIKNATPENLLPRGGGAFLNEVDGNLTCVKREQISEVHWLGKFRGPDFAPLSFKIQPGTTELLKDSKGRLIWTVTARPMEAQERATADTVNARNEDRVLKLLVTQPRLSLTEMAQALQWFYASGEPDKTRVYRALKTLETDQLVKKRGDHYEPTKEGKRKAENLAPDRETVETPM